LNRGGQTRDERMRLLREIKSVYEALRDEYRKDVENIQKKKEENEHMTNFLSGIK
jgi:hypothetical protein